MIVLKFKFSYNYLFWAISIWIVRDKEYPINFCERKGLPLASQFYSLLRFTYHLHMSTFMWFWSRSFICIESREKNLMQIIFWWWSNLYNHETEFVSEFLLALNWRNLCSKYLCWFFRTSRKIDYLLLLVSFRIEFTSDIFYLKCISFFSEVSKKSDNHELMLDVQSVHWKSMRDEYFSIQERWLWMCSCVCVYVFMLSLCS